VECQSRFLACFIGGDFLEAPQPTTSFSSNVILAISDKEVSIFPRMAMVMMFSYGLLCWMSTLQHGDCSCRELYR